MREDSLHLVGRTPLFRGIIRSLVPGLGQRVSSFGQALCGDLSEEPLLGTSPLAWGSRLFVYSRDSTAATNFDWKQAACGGLEILRDRFRRLFQDDAGRLINSSFDHVIRELRRPCHIHFKREQKGTAALRRDLEGIPPFHPRTCSANCWSPPRCPGIGSLEARHA